MLRSRQRTLWVVCIVAVWLVGVYVVYQKATSANLMNTWPAAAKKHVKPNDDSGQKFLADIDRLEEEEAKNVATYKELNKKFLYYIDKKFKSKRKEEPIIVPQKEVEVKVPRLPKEEEQLKEEEEAEIFENKSDPKKQQQQIALPGPNDGPTEGGIRIPVIVFACNRVSVSKCLDNLLLYRPNAHQFPIIVSQDCGDAPTKDIILSYGDNVTLIEQPDLSDIAVPPKDKKFKGYYKIARHYGWALNTVFDRGFEFVIIVEDDLNVAPDFFEYFMGTHTLLREDPSLWCISAWNDNGKESLIDLNAAKTLYRTDFFPGLGWMLSSALWTELAPKWPKSFWDDWIRNPEQRKGRSCIRPEISRTRTFGKIGVSNGMFFDKHLKYIKLSENPVNFTAMDLSYLKKDEYDKAFLQYVYDCPLVVFDELRQGMVKHKRPIRILYRDRMQYKRITKGLGLMDDFKSGVPRTSYHGIVSLFYQGQRIYLAPNLNWKGYDPSWS